MRKERTTEPSAHPSAQPAAGRVSGRIYIQCNAPTFYEEIATIRLKDRYSNGKKTWRATLNVECPKCAKLHATVLQKKRRESATCNGCSDLTGNH